MANELKSAQLGDIRRITAGLTRHEHPAVSPDARFIAYYAGPFGCIDIYVADLEGRLARSMTSGFGNNTQPAWSPDGLTLAWRHQDSEQAKWEIHAAPVFDEAAVTDVMLKDPQWHFKHPCFSPDAKELAYFSDEGSPENYHLWILELKSGKRRQITSGQDQNHSHPVFSPDGRRLIYHAYEGAQMTEPAITNIYEVEIASGKVQACTEGDAGQYKHPFYLTDDLITYHHEVNATGRRGLYLMQLSTRREFELTDGENNDKHPFPYRDEQGKAHLAFASKKLGREHSEEDKTYDIFTARLELEEQD